MPRYRCRFEKGQNLVPDSVNQDPQHPRHKESEGAAGEAVLNNVNLQNKNKNSPVMGLT
jgi:hypothetical protein